VFSVATKFAFFLKRRSVLAVVVLALASFFAARFGVHGIWDGPI
jgi:hypothetical protein